MDDVARRLRRRRLDLGMNKSQLARQAGICHSVITRIESGEYRYSRHLFRIADELGVSVDWLVRGKQPMRHTARESTCESIPGLVAESAYPPEL